LRACERRPGPSLLRDDPGQIAVDDASLASKALFDRQSERPFKIIDPVYITELGAREAAELERECRLRQAELRREGDGPIGGLDRRLAVPGDRLVPGQVRVGGDKFRSGGLRLKQLDRLLDEVPGS